MGVPILRQADVLIASFQSSLTDADLEALRDHLVQRAGERGVRGVVIDVTALDVLDSFAARTIGAMTQMLALRGARTVIVGIQPEVAFAMVQLGLHMGDIQTALDLDDGLALLRGGRDG